MHTKFGLQANILQENSGGHWCIAMEKIRCHSDSELKFLGMLSKIFTTSDNIVPQMIGQTGQKDKDAVFSDLEYCEENTFMFYQHNTKCFFLAFCL